MTNVKNILNSRGLFYWILMIGLLVKVIDIYLTAKGMFYLEHILQGFVLTILMPTLFIATTMGFASLIESKWLSYTVTCVIAFLGSGLLFFGMLYYRLKKHFIFFPDKIPTGSSGNQPQLYLFSQIHIGDIVFAVDFIIIMIVLLAVLVLNQVTSESSDTSTLFEEGQKMLTVLQSAMEQIKENLIVQETLLIKAKDKNVQLTEHNTALVHEKSDLQEKCRNSQPGLQKEMAYCKTENINLMTSLKELKSVKNQLEAEQFQKEQALKAAKARHERQLDEKTQQSVEVVTSELQEKIQEAKKIAKQICGEMQARSQTSQQKIE